MHPNEIQDFFDKLTRYISYNEDAQEKYWPRQQLVKEAEALKQHVLRQRPKKDDIDKLIEYIKDECDHLMSRADHRKHVAEVDYHNSEVYHQEGRWHCANDLKEFCETKLLQKLNPPTNTP